MLTSPNHTHQRFRACDSVSLYSVQKSLRVFLCQAFLHGDISSFVKISYQKVQRQVMHTSERCTSCSWYSRVPIIYTRIQQRSLCFQSHEHAFCGVSLDPFAVSLPLSIMLSPRCFCSWIVKEQVITVITCHYKYCHLLLQFLFWTVNLNCPRGSSLPPRPNLSQSQLQISPVILIMRFSTSALLVALPLASGFPFSSLFKRADLSSTTQNDIVNNAPCKPLTIIFARGTNSAGNVGESTGPPFFKAVAAAIGADNLAVQGVTYSANIFGMYTLSLPTLNKFRYANHCQQTNTD